MKIIEAIGAGGMGEVYRARDPRLNRDVAIKISAERFSERFEREARAAAALNHPGICTLHDVGPNFLVMELVEGPTLAERIAAEAIPLEEALHIARQIADALAVLSPDGRRMAFVVRSEGGAMQIWVRALDTFEARPLAGTEGVENVPVWSPDSRSIGFETGRGQFADLKRVEVSGGPPQI